MEADQRSLNFCTKFLKHHNLKLNAKHQSIFTTQNTENRDDWLQLVEAAINASKRSMPHYVDVTISLDNSYDLTVIRIH